MAFQKIIERLVDSIFGYDFFVSYTWADGSKYAHSLYEKLKAQGFTVFLDEEDYARGDNWTLLGRRALKKTRQLILVATPKVHQSAPVLKELTAFESTGRRVIPVEIGDALDPKKYPESPLLPLISPDLLKINQPFEQDGAIPNEAPSEVVRELRRGFQHVRQAQLRVRFLLGVTAVLAMLLVTVITKWWQAVAAQRLAERQTHLASARELTLQSEKFLPSDPQLSLALAYYAAKEVLASGAKLQAEANALLQRVILANPKTLRGPGAQAICWSPDGTKLIVGSQDNKARVFDWATQKALGVLEGHTDWLEDVAWSPDGRFLATAARDGTARLWDALDYRLIDTISCGKTQVQTVSFHPRKPWLAVAHTAGSDDTPMEVRVWDFEARMEKFHVPGFRAAFSPDGTKLACGDGAGWGSVQLFDIEGKLLATLPGHTRYVHTLAWSPDSVRLATASVDDTVRIWDTIRGVAVSVLSNKFALCAAWSPDSRYLASGGGERLVKLWDSKTLAEVGSISSVLTLTGEPTRSGADDYIIGIAWSPDGSLLAVADRGGWVSKKANVCARIYATQLFTAKSTEDLLEVARQHILRPRSLVEVRKAVESRSNESTDEEQRESGQ